MVAMTNSNWKTAAGVVIKQHRNRSKLTAQYVADTIGINRVSQMRRESGTKMVGLPELSVYAKLFDVPLKKLVAEIERHAKRPAAT